MQALTKGLLLSGVTALALTGSVVLLPQLASAGSIEHRGDFGGSWTHIGPGDNYRVRRHEYYGAPIYVAPSYAYGLDYGDPYGYGPPDDYDYGYDYGPGVAIGGPGVGLSIGID
jgi:hypothetical protein